MNDTVSFRSMTIEDIEAVMRIEHATFPTPWSRSAFYNEIVINHFATLSSTGSWRRSSRLLRGMGHY